MTKLEKLYSIIENSRDQWDYGSQDADTQEQHSCEK